MLINGNLKLKRSIKRAGSYDEWFNALTIIAAKVDRRSLSINHAAGLLRSIINQNYVDDIKILADYKFHNPLRLPPSRVRRKCWLPAKTASIVP